MIANPDGDLHVYTVNVGQGDCTVIVTPAGNVIVIDAMRPAKIVRLLNDLQLDGTIEQFVVTHPHADHFSGGNGLAAAFNIREATLAPFWHEFGMGPPTYRALVGRLADNGTLVTFLSGYTRWYPDGALTTPAGGGPEVDEDAPFLEMLGPTNALVEELEDSNTFNTNHLTIMSRLTWRGFRMVSAGDAQMENWRFFDSERMMEQRCQVLRAAHHGSKNGTQWERVDRLGPTRLIVSSDPGGQHHIPDLTGAAVFATFDDRPGHAAFLTDDTMGSGTIHLTVAAGGGRTFERFGEGRAANVDLTAGVPLQPGNNPTDWSALVDTRLNEL